MTYLAIALGLAGALAAPPAQDDGPDDPPPLELRDGDRVVLVGDALIERMQDFGYFETLLTAAHPDKAITFRNLGWSGDTVFGEARAEFGTPEDGFKTLIEQVKATEPTVLIVGYGANESWAGEEGLPRFRDGMNRLLEALEATGPREIVLLSPIAQRGGPGARTTATCPNAEESSGSPPNGDIATLMDVCRRDRADRGRAGLRFVDLLRIGPSEPLARRASTGRHDLRGRRRPPHRAG